MIIKRIKTVLTCFIIFYSNNINAQSFIAEEIIEKYPPSVYSQVYEITLATLIPHEKQIRFAKFLIKKDSLVMAATKQEKSIKYIKNMLDSLQIVFDKIFDSEELLKLNYFKYQSYFEADAKMNAAYVKQKFEAESDIEKSLYKLNIAKNQRVLKAMLTNTSFTNLTDSNKTFYYKYDSVVNKYKIAAEGELYFKNKIEELNKVKTLSAKDKDELRRNYQILCLKRGDAFHNNFNAAMQFCISDTVYYKLLYQDSINIQAKKQSKTELDNYVFKYNLNDEARNKIVPILEEKANANIWLDTRYAFNRKRDSLQTEINEISWAKIKKVLIRLGNTQLSKSKFVNAIIYKQPLHISENQLDILAEENYKLDLINYTYTTSTKGALFDYSLYVNEKLKNILSEGQFDTLLQIEVRPQALASTEENWKQLIKHNLVNGLDSAGITNQIVGYHMVRLILWERYKNDIKTYDKLLKENRQNKPEILKRLDAVKKEVVVGEAEKTKVAW